MRENSRRRQRRPLRACTALSFHTNEMMIREIKEQDDFTVCAGLLNDAFSGVAREFGLTRENSATHNAFITSAELKSQLTKTRGFYCYEEEGVAVGFVAVEKSSKNPELFYIEKLAVHPDYRHRGIGRLLMDFASGRIAELGGKRISIGMIDSHAILKEWYLGQGFAEVAVKSFDHLPFTVCLMEKAV